MSTTSSARRIKERPIPKALTPIPNPTGKENPNPNPKTNPNPSSRPTSRARSSAQKPVSQPVPPRIQRSNSSSSGSAPKGRNSSPFELTRFLSDMRRDNNNNSNNNNNNSSSSRDLSVSSGRRSVSSSGRVIDRKNNGVLRDSSNVRSRERVGRGNVERIEEIEKKKNNGSKFERSDGVSTMGLEKIESLRDSSAKMGKRVEKANRVFEKRGIVEVGMEKSGEIRINESKFDVLDTGLLKNGVLIDPDVKSSEKVGKIDGVAGARSKSALRGLENSKENGLVEENTSTRGFNKYPSKLHEKLAFLEGKVKRIASDIKRTKDMLDMNNPDSSKVIISDIQNKISGIEKAMGSVVSGDNPPSNLLEINVEKKEVDNVKSAVKGLNSEELESRLFPHHKLLRDRTLLKATYEEVNASSKPVDENPVKVEPMALLGMDQNKVTLRGENGGLENSGVQETDGDVISQSQDALIVAGKEENQIILTTDERLDEFDDQQMNSDMIIEEDMEERCIYQFNEIGHKISTGGWFVGEGEAALLAHDDGSCSYYDIAHSEVKAEYKSPIVISPNIWQDCWIVRAPGTDGSSGRYVVAASAGNTLDSGFCSWNFHNKDICAFHVENGTTSSRTALAPLPNNPSHRRNSFSSILASENRQWWYKPCGPLITSTASNQRGVTIYDIRDGEQIMEWELPKPVLSMDYSSPLQWRNRGKIVVAETESISVWDVSSLNPQSLLSISTSGRRVSALHVNNTDAELGGGVRQRTSSSEAEGNDGVFCTADSLNVLDFRNPSGIGFKISKHGVDVQSVSSRGDSIFLGCSTNARGKGTKQPCPQIQQFSLRKQRLLNTYTFPDTNAHPHYVAITQVWGNSKYVMGVCGLGLFVFDAMRDDVVQSLSKDNSCMQKVKDTIGPDDLYSPSFDYLSDRVLLISRDRPALWRYLS